MIIFVGDTTFEKDGTEELVVAIPAFVGEAKEEEEDHCTVHRSPATDLCGNVEGAILAPDYRWEKNDATKVGVCICPTSPR